MKAIKFLRHVLLAAVIGYSMLGMAMAVTTTKPAPPITVIAEAQSSDQGFTVDALVSTSLSHHLAEVQLLIPDSLSIDSVESWQGLLPVDQQKSVQWLLNLSYWNPAIKVQVTLWLDDDILTLVFPVLLTDPVPQTRSLPAVPVQSGQRGDEPLSIIPLNPGGQR